MEGRIRKVTEIKFPAVTQPCGCVILREEKNAPNFDGQFSVLSHAYCRLTTCNLHSSEYSTILNTTDFSAVSSPSGSGKKPL